MNKETNPLFKHFFMSDAVNRINPSNLKLSILVDYAHEPESMKQLLGTLQAWKWSGIYDYIIHIVSCDGAGRDNWKKPIMGKISFDNSDFSIVTLDNYDENDNPKEILAMLSEQLPPQLEGKKYFKTPSRREALEVALLQAQEVAGKIETPFKVLIVSTGVGSENGLTQPGGVMEWDEATQWQGLFAKMLIR
jgi:UDP-N-acetylmuramyl tripeptide synthase